MSHVQLQEPSQALQARNAAQVNARLTPVVPGWGIGYSCTDVYLRAGALTPTLAPQVMAPHNVSPGWTTRCSFVAQPPRLPAGIQFNPATGEFTLHPAARTRANVLVYVSLMESRPHSAPRELARTSLSFHVVDREDTSDPLAALATPSPQAKRTRYDPLSMASHGLHSAMQLLSPGLHDLYGDDDSGLASPGVGPVSVSPDDETLHNANAMLAMASPSPASTASRRRGRASGATATAAADTGTPRLRAVRRRTSSSSIATKKRASSTKRTSKTGSAGRGRGRPRKVLAAASSSSASASSAASKANAAAGKAAAATAKSGKATPGGSKKKRGTKKGGKKGGVRRALSTLSESVSLHPNGAVSASVGEGPGPAVAGDGVRAGQKRSRDRVEPAGPQLTASTDRRVSKRSASRVPESDAVPSLHQDPYGMLHHHTYSRFQFRVVLVCVVPTSSSHTAMWVHCCEQTSRISFLMTPPQGFR